MTITWTIGKTAPLVREVGRLDFGILDERGREVGFMAHVVEERPMTEAERASRHVPQAWQDEASLGRPWRLSFRATRNRIGFGASNRDRHFATESEARAAAEQIATATRKRYARKYRGGGAA